MLLASDGISDHVMLFAAFFLCVAFAAYFSCAESAYAGLNKIRIKNLADSGDKRAQRAAAISNSFDRALTTILIGTNVLHIGCSSIATLIAATLWGENAVVYATLVTTVIVFFLSEMIPKSYAAANSTQVALGLSGSLRVLMKLLAPVTFLFMGVSRLVTRLFKKEDAPTVTEEELSTIIETVEEEGGMSEDQSELLQSAMEFPTTTVADILTARDDIVAVDVHMTPEELLARIREAKHSRLPVWDGGPDNAVGVLSIRKYLKESIRTGTPDVRALMAPPFFVSPEEEIGDLFKRMTQNKISLAIVQDDGGRTVGLITVEDFLEELVGEIWDEDDVVDESFIKLGGNRFRVSGTLRVGEAFSRMGYECPDRSILQYPVQAWALSCYGHVPEEDEEVDYRSLTLRVESMSEGRIVSLDVKVNDPAPLPDGAPERGDAS
jgi:CBS domain containing-hemolysin-like protein